MNSIKSFLRKWPNFYSILQRIYYGFRRFLELHILGTKLQEWIWSANRGKDYVNEGRESISHPHRKFLLDKILYYSPFENILEIGCNAGPNLYLFSKQFPHVKLYGIDINGRAIEEGKKHFKEEGISNVSLAVGRADRLASFADKSIDVVFTDAVLMYVGPDKICGVISEMVRIARKAVIFNEWHHNSINTKRYFYHYGHWVYDYAYLLSSYGSLDSIKTTKIPKEIWGDPGGWEKYGSIIEVELQKAKIE